uniref:RNA polymerase alpha subunit n=1 Tax=Lepocinclis tripteris TaxID=135494 RepID=A0A3G3LKZ4_9EUGL|nr:RNA polymerase alpha subunit [Lepocinclis tripteris]AYQ93379.1 RNA polymerase alpha subunit [Lepocinclis tripteris]
MKLLNIFVINSYKNLKSRFLVIKIMNIDNPVTLANSIRSLLLKSNLIKIFYYYFCSWKIFNLILFAKDLKFSKCFFPINEYIFSEGFEYLDSDIFTKFKSIKILHNKKLDNYNFLNTFLDFDSKTSAFLQEDIKFLKYDISIPIDFSVKCPFDYRIFFRFYL